MKDAFLEVDSARAGDPVLVAIDASGRVGTDGHMWTSDRPGQVGQIFRLRVQLSEYHRRELAVLISANGERVRTIAAGDLALQVGADSPVQHEAVRRVFDVAAERAGYTLT